MLKRHIFKYWLVLLANGWPDKKGSVWIPTGNGPKAHSGPHWDVQHPGGSYDNV